MNIKKIMQTNFIKSLIKFGNTNFVGKLIIGLFIWSIVFIPTYFFFLIRWAVDPIGFWQEIALICVFCLATGWLQVFCIFMGVALTLMLISKKQFLQGLYDASERLERKIRRYES